MTDDEKVWFWFHEEAKLFKKWKLRLDLGRCPSTVNIVSFDGRIVKFYYGKERRDVNCMYVYHFLDVYKKVEYA